MKQLIYRSLLMAMCIVVVACSSDDTTAEPTSYCYISGVTLGTLTRSITTNGITTETTYQGSEYGISIDQRKGIITNVTPLLIGTDLSSVPITITAEGSVAYAPVSDTSVWSYYSSSATVSFLEPLLLRTYATDGSGYREYTMTLTVRDKEKGEYTWETLEAPVLADRKARRAVSWNDGLLLLSADEGGLLHVNTWADNVWSDDKSCTGADGAILTSLQSFSGQLWMNTGSGQLLTSTDGEAWTPVVTQDAEDHEVTVVTLLAASTKALYARIYNASTETECIASSTDGSQWTSMNLEKSFSLFPTQGAAVSYKKNGNPRVLVAGTVTDKETTTTCVWNFDEEHDSEWMLFSKSGDNQYILPWQDGMTIIAYSGWLIAVSGDQTTTYRSEDNGITWKSYSQLTLPCTDEHFAVTVAGNHIYIFAGAQMQRAYVND